MELSKNALRKFRKYGIIPQAVKEFQELENFAWKKHDQYGEKTSWHAEAKPVEKHLKKYEFIDMGIFSRVANEKGSIRVIAQKEAEKFARNF